MSACVDGILTFYSWGNLRLMKCSIFLSSTGTVIVESESSLVTIVIAGVAPQ